MSDLPAWLSFIAFVVAVAATWHVALQRLQTRDNVSLKQIEDFFSEQNASIEKQEKALANFLTQMTELVRFTEQKRRSVEAQSLGGKSK